MRPPPSDLSTRVGIICAALCLQDIFQEGERVRCMIERVDYDAQRINLNTADLEEIAGDMLMDKVRVMTSCIPFLLGIPAYVSCFRFCHA